ncbi:hypothetical protein J7E93_07360 [Streptomyces sp. ISL-36]|uniref:hypothetical protein n=1 Tax=Streptomyces sp. ISL-36 TaxID=2819182 RepID=UPI001BE5CE10|nr:hypothetical protein [Streptomyces sp. ISL-36]MBT2439941.1 hypothetical protein [Streptomyces sp. ISL-36]
MTKTGSDHLKRRARQLARVTGRRYPDVLAELRRTPRPAAAPSKELVRVCNGLAHPIDIADCARTAGHERFDGTPWSSCEVDPHYPVHIWAGYFHARSEAYRAEYDAWWNSLTPEQREEEEARYWDEMAADAAEPVDPGFYADLDDEDYLDEDGE